MITISNVFADADMDYYGLQTLFEMLAESEMDNPILNALARVDDIEDIYEDTDLNWMSGSSLNLIAIRIDNDIEYYRRRSNCKSPGIENFITYETDDYYLYDDECEEEYDEGKQMYTFWRRKMQIMDLMVFSMMNERRL